METLFQSNNAVPFLLANSTSFSPIGSAKWKARPYNSESEALGDYKPITTLIPSNEYGCVRPFGAGISLIYAGTHEDH